MILDCLLITEETTIIVTCSTLTVAANGRDVITAVVEVVALHITVAARVSLAVVSSTASSIAGCCTACRGGVGGSSLGSPDWVSIRYKPTKGKEGKIGMPHSE